MTHVLRTAAAVAAAALAVPALAHGLASDPTQPEGTNPAPAISLHGSGRAEADALNADPTWPGIERAAPAVRLSGRGEWASAGAILGDEPMASAVRAAASSRVAAR